MHAVPRQRLRRFAVPRRVQQQRLDVVRRRVSGVHAALGGRESHCLYTAVRLAVQFVACVRVAVLALQRRRLPADPVLSVGAVVGITIAVSLVGGAICVPLLVVFFYALANWSDEMDDEDPSFAFILVGLLSIPFGVAIFALAVGLPLGLSPSVCCS
jgi:hypothetical protein